MFWFIKKLKFKRYISKNTIQTCSSLQKQSFLCHTHFFRLTVGKPVGILRSFIFKFRIDLCYLYSSLLTEP